MAIYPNYYYPAGYQPAQYNSYPTQQGVGTAQPTQSSGIIWVQGEAGAKAYPVASGNSVLLMDTEDAVLYLKSVDQSGMPQPLRVFELKEKSAQNHSNLLAGNEMENNSKEELEALRAQIRNISERVNKLEMKKEENGDG